MSIITIVTWLVNRVDPQLMHRAEFKIEEAKWSAMSETERDQYAKDYARRTGLAFKEST